MAPAIMCFGRKPADPESKRNEDIEKNLRTDRKRAEREVKLLLLGRAPLASPGVLHSVAKTILQVPERVASPPSSSRCE